MGLLIFRIFLGIFSGAGIIGFVTVLLGRGSRNIGALVCLFFCFLLLLYAFFAPKVNKKIRTIWHQGGAGKHLLQGLCVVLVLLVLCIIAESILMAIYSHKKAPASSRPPVVIVLGCMARNGKPSTLLQSRIDTAYDYLVSHPECPCIVSGGQGPDETISEAECMYQELVKKGIEPSRIYIEGNSKTTRQNLKYSKELMEKENLGDTAVIVTNGWHEFRAYLIAKDLGLSCGTEGAPTPWWLFPANYTRELMAIVYQLLF